MTKTLAMRPGILTELSAELRDELCSLPLRQSADRLRGRDPALIEDAVRLHATVLRHRQQHVEDLGREHVLRRIEQQCVDVRLARFQVLLQLRASGADVVGAFESVHPLVQRSLGSGGGGLDWGRHVGGEYSRGSGACKAMRANYAEIHLYLQSRFRRRC